MKVLYSCLRSNLFILVWSIVVPSTIASSYRRDREITVAFIQRTLCGLGLAGILQTLLGHLLPIQEGPAGLWWGVFSLYAGIGPILFGSHNETLRTFQYAFLLSGVMFIMLSLFGWIEKIARL